MTLFLMRHGEAGQHSQSDSLRELTARGREEARVIVEDNKSDLLSVDIIWHSPYVRARQTAEIAADILQKKLQPISSITPSGNPIKVMDELENSQKKVLMISHQPLVGILLDSLAGLEPGRHRMGTAALAYIETEVFAKNCGALRWLHQPEFA